MDAAAQAKPWYREPWPWILMAGPAIVVVAGIATAVLAYRGADGVVAADYYKRGLAINDEVTRARAAAALGLQAAVEFSSVAAGERVQVHLGAQQPLPPEATLRLRLIHPGRSDADRVAVLARTRVDADGRSADYAGAWDDTAARGGPVAWRVMLESRAWRLDGAVGGSIRDGQPSRVELIAQP